MDANQRGDSRSSSNRTVAIPNPSAALIDAVRAQVELPSPDAGGHWELGVVRAVEVEVQLTRVTHHGDDATTEQPIMWSEGPL